MPLEREFLERAPEPTFSGNGHKENSLVAPSNPCHDLVFTHKEQIPSGGKKSQKKQRGRGLDAKLKGEHQQNTGVFNIEKIKIYKSGLIKMGIMIKKFKYQSSSGKQHFF